MCGVGKGPPKNHKENFKKCQEFFLSAHSSVRAEGQRFAALVKKFLRPSANPVKVFQ